MKTEEELDALDRKALEEEYVNSYTYATTQKVLGCFAAICILAVLIIGGTYLFVSLLDLIVK